MNSYSIEICHKILDGAPFMVINISVTDAVADCDPKVRANLIKKAEEKLSYMIVSPNYPKFGNGIPTFDLDDPSMLRAYFPCSWEIASRSFEAIKRVLHEEFDCNVNVVYRGR